jgi:hypothetical protein
VSEEREKAMLTAIKALLLTAKHQGIHVEALCDGAVRLIKSQPDVEPYSVVATAAIRGLAYDVARGL